MKNLVTKLIILTFLCTTFSFNAKSADVGVSHFGFTNFEANDNELELGVSYQLFFYIKNFDTQEFPSTGNADVEVSVHFIDGGNIEESINFDPITFPQGTINADDSVDVAGTLTIPEDLPTGTMTVCVEATTQGDTDPSNDSTCIVFEIVDVEHNYAITDLLVPVGDEIDLIDTLFGFIPEFTNNGNNTIKQGTVIRLNYQGSSMSMPPLEQEIEPQSTINLIIELNQPFIVGNSFDEGDTLEVCFEALLSNDVDPTNNEYCRTYTVVDGSVSVTDIEAILNLNLYPNPVSSQELHLDFYLPESKNVSLTLYDLSGKKVKNIELGKLKAGNQSHSVELSGLSNGNYIYNLRAGNHVSTGNLQLAQ